MRVQTYTNWAHRYAAPLPGSTVPQPPDDLVGVIDTLIAQVAYCPSFSIQITSDAQGLLLQGAQRVVQTHHQRDGMVVLRTQAGQV